MKYELNHDVVAKQIFERASADMKARRKVELLVKNAYEFYVKRKALMTKEQLEEVQPFRQDLNLSAEETDFIDKSAKALTAAQRRKFIVTTAVIAALAILAAVALWQWREAVGRARTAESGRLSLLAQQQFAEYNFNDAFNLAQQALVLNPNSLSATDILSKIFHRPFDGFITPLSTATIQEHQRVTQVNLSQDGHFSAILLADSTVKIYDISHDAQLIGAIAACDVGFNPIFSPNNEQILTLTRDNVIQINKLDGKEVAILRGHTQQLKGAIFFNQDTIITWAFDGFIKMWNAQGTFLRDIGKREAFIETVEISSDKTHILSKSDDHVAVIWSLKQGEPACEIKELPTLKAATFWNKDSVLLLGEEGLELWSSKHKQRVVRTLPLANIGNAPKFSANADKLIYLKAGGGYISITRLRDFFDFFGGKNKEKEKLMRAYQRENNMRAFEPADFLQVMTEKPNVDAKQVGFFNMYDVWTINEGSNEVVLRSSVGNKMVILTHPSPVESVVFAAKNMVAATFSSDGIIKIWKHNAPNLLTFTGSVNDRNNGSSAIYLSPDEKRIVTIGRTSPMAWYDANGKFLNAFYDFYAQRIAFSPKSEAIIALPYTGAPIIFDTLGQIIKKLSMNINGIFRGVDYTADGSHFMIYDGKKVYVFTKNGDLIQDKIQVTDTLLDVRFTPNSQHILTASRDNFVSEWDMQGNFIKHIVKNERIISLDLSPNGTFILTGDNDGITTLRDYDTGKTVRQYGQKSNKYIISATFFPNGKTILAIDSDNHATLYDINGKTVKQNVFGGKLANVHFFNNSKELLVVSADSYELWTKDNQCITTYNHLNQYDAQPTQSVNISKDDTHFIMGFNDGTARQYLTPKGISIWLKQHSQMRFMDLEKLRYNIEN